MNKYIKAAWKINDPENEGIYIFVDSGVWFTDPESIDKDRGTIIWTKDTDQYWMVTINKRALGKIVMSDIYKSMPSLFGTVLDKYAFMLINPMSWKKEDDGTVTVEMPMFTADDPRYIEPKEEDSK